MAELDTTEKEIFFADNSRFGVLFRFSGDTFEKERVYHWGNLLGVSKFVSDTGCILFYWNRERQGELEDLVRYLGFGEVVDGDTELDWSAFRGYFWPHQCFSDNYLRHLWSQDYGKHGPDTFRVWNEKHPHFRADGTRVIY